MADDEKKTAAPAGPDFRTRVEVALLTIAEAVADTASHSGYSVVKKLPDEIQDILDGKLPEVESDTAPKPATGDDKT